MKAQPLTAKAAYMFTSRPVRTDRKGKTMKRWNRLTLAIAAILVLPTPTTQAQTQGKGKALILGNASSTVLKSLGSKRQKVEGRGIAQRASVSRVHRFFVPLPALYRIADA